MKFAPSFLAAKSLSTINLRKDDTSIFVLNFGSRYQVSHPYIVYDTDTEYQNKAQGSKHLPLRVRCYFLLAINLILETKSWYQLKSISQVSLLVSLLLAVGITDTQADTYHKNSPKHGASLNRSFLLFAEVINQVEASGRKTLVPPGDGGLAIGPLQIHKEYHHDAILATPSLAGSWDRCNDWCYSVQVMHSYLKHHASKALARNDWQTLARIHNGGPDGASSPNTMSYWVKVQWVMKQNNLCRRAGFKVFSGCSLVEQRRHSS